MSSERLNLYDFHTNISSVSVGLPWNTGVYVVPGNCFWVFNKRPFGTSSGDIVSASIHFIIDVQTISATSIWMMVIGNSVSSTIATASITQNNGSICKIRFVYVDGDTVDFVITDGNVSIETITNTIFECVFACYEIGI